MSHSPPYVGQLLTRLYRTHLAVLTSRLRPLGLTPAQHQVILHLGELGEQTQRQLADGLGVEQATMANTLSRMSRDGLIERKPHPDDGRAQLNALTAAAHELAEPARRAAERCDLDMIAELPEAERALFASMLARLEAAIETRGKRDP